MSEIPSHWAQVPLSELGGLVGGKTPSKSVPTYWTNGTIPWTSPKDMKSFLIKATEDYIATKAVHEAGMQVLPVDSVLMVTRSGILAHTFPVAIAAVPTTINRDIKALRPSDAFIPRYIAYALRNAEEQILSSCSKAGTTVASVETDLLERFPLPLAPLNEQKRIADKLDAVLAEIDACRERLDRVPAILKRFRQSVLAAATSGKLTEEWREEHGVRASGRDVVEQDAEEKQKLLNRDPSLMKKKSTVESSIDTNYVFDIPEQWVFSTWGTVSEWITYGFTRPMPHADEGVPLLTAKDIQNFAVEFQRTENTTRAAFAELSEKDRPKLGDLLLTKDGTIGRAALVRTEVPFCINQSVAVCWLRSTTMNKSYLELVANADFTQQFIRDKAKGMAIQHLSITDFAQCPLPVPPLPEQHEIARLVESLFAYADRLEARYSAARTHVERLTPALLAKAFRGELVPQDPNDEPAAVLLERIRAVREAAPVKSRQRKGSSQSKMQKAEDTMLDRKDIQDALSR